MWVRPRSRRSVGRSRLRAVAMPQAGLCLIAFRGEFCWPFPRSHIRSACPGLDRIAYCPAARRRAFRCETIASRGTMLVVEQFARAPGVASPGARISGRSPLRSAGQTLVRKRRVQDAEGHDAVRRSHGYACWARLQPPRAHPAPTVRLQIRSGLFKFARQRFSVRSAGSCAVPKAGTRSGACPRRPRDCSTGGVETSERWTPCAL